MTAPRTTAFLAAASLRLRLKGGDRTLVDQTSDDGVVEEQFERYAAELFDTRDQALLEAKRFFVSLLAEREALHSYSQGADTASALALFDWRTDTRPPIPGDELPEGYVRR